VGIPLWHPDPSLAGLRNAILVVDTATSGNRTSPDVGVGVSSSRAFSFWGCLPITDEAGDKLFRTVHEMCASLSQRGFAVQMITTQNATNEIAMVGNVRIQLGLPVFWVPCLSQTATLAVKDFVVDALPQDHNLE
jgi:hypothetical protein